MGRKKASNVHAGDEDGPPVAAPTKSKKKGLVIDDDEYSIATEPTDESVAQEEKVVITGKKKGKKGSTKVSQSKGDEDVEKVEENEDEGSSEIVFAGKKKSKAKKGAFELLGDEDGGEIVDDKDEDEAPVIEFVGKKKKSSKGRSSLAFGGFGALGDDDDDNDEQVDEKKDENDDFAAEITFMGKKKSSKGSKKKGHVSFAELNEDVGDEKGEATDSVQPQQATVEVAETSKSKKKKKKSGRTAQEEDDLDAILAELGELPKPVAEEPVQEEKVEAQPETTTDEKGGEEESAAAKKKKKKKEKEKEKKEKEKEKKAEVKEEKPMEAKMGNNKKLPKHVREMQEALARRKEAEERAKKEEEEKQKREEEARLKQEELDRAAEEARRRKKEREKEKLQKKRQEGKLLTAKQKEEARRLEAMRNQILSSAGGLGLPGDTAAPTKRPLYQKKKSKPTPNSSKLVVETVEEKESQPDEVDSPEEAMEEVEEKSEVAESVQEEVEDESEDEWDAKSWDDINISVNAFADEEAESESEPVPKKELNKSVSSTTGNADTKIASTAPPEDSKKPNKAQEKRQVAVEVSGKNKEKEADDTPKGEANLRSPICCIMGHVDTGKTKLLDCIRGTNVQEGEAGGITQQIGATYFPADNIRERTKELKANAILKVPGLLIIDTPGHESFTNLRSRGSGLCDIAVLVVDIMHGLEPQTIESLNLLKMRNTEFIVALNKVDRLYGWKTQRNAPIRNTLKQQTKDVINEFNMRLKQIITQFMEQGINTELYYKNNDLGGTYNIVPTSAITGEGLPDLLLLLVNWTQRTMVEKLTFSNEVQCTVLEVKVVEGHGTTIDVVLVNGVLHEGEQIVVCGMQGPIVTTIRALLTPHPMKELRVKGTYLHHKQIKAAQGIKITAQGLEHAIAGTGLYVVGPNDDVEEIKETTMEDMKSVMSRIDRSGEGVCVQSSTLGSLEALLEFLKTPEVNIPVSGISIGPVHKKDVMKASVMLEKKKEYATILAFDVKVTPDARELAEELGVTIFMADIIYHLFDQFKAYIDNIKEEKKKETADEAVFPCILEILPNCVFNKKDPIVLGVDVLEGIAKVGTPLCIITKEDCIDIGRIASIENNHKPVDTAKKGLKVAIKIVGTNSEEQQKMFGRHFEMEDQLVSHISRRSIDLLKANYRDDLSMEEWRLVVKLKSLLKIQ